MLAVIDSRSPSKAIDTLGKYVKDIFLFESRGITYNSISGHPDIFIFQFENDLVIAPNSPDELIRFFKKYRVSFTFGKSYIDESLKKSVPYNCISTDQYFFHKKNMTDYVVLRSYSEKEFINLPQAYTRCSMIHLGGENFITSDEGIKMILDKHGINNLFFSPEDIKIIDHKHGFFGGTCGIAEDMIIINGNIDKHKDGKKARIFIERSGIEIIKLHDDLLYDGGGIFFI